MRGDLPGVKHRGSPSPLVPALARGGPGGYHRVQRREIRAGKVTRGIEREGPFEPPACGLGVAGDRRERGKVIKDESTQRAG